MLLIWNFVSRFLKNLTQTVNKLPPNIISETDLIKRDTVEPARVKASAVKEWFVHEKQLLV